MSLVAPDLLPPNATAQERALAEALARLVPTARVARLDRDTANNAAGLTAVLKAVAAREVDLLVGTQMITKGHHFPGIRLVGVLSADQALALPDFRAAERVDNWTLRAIRLSILTGDASKKDARRVADHVEHMAAWRAAALALSQGPPEPHTEEPE